jgi:hypothetical protein
MGERDSIMMDDHSRMRLIALGIIWGAIAIIGVRATEALADAPFWLVVALAIMLVFGVGGSAIAFEPWRYDRFSEKSSEKAKRRGRVEKFLDTLSDDELEQLRGQLSNDGDVYTLEQMATAKRR